MSNYLKFTVGYLPSRNASAGKVTEDRRVLKSGLINIKRILSSFTTVLLVLSTGPALNAFAQIKIDDFAGDKRVENSRAANSLATFANVKRSEPNATVGGFRAYSVQLTKCPGQTITGGSISAATDIGYFHHQSDALACGKTKITWDGDEVPNNLNTAGLKGVDLGDPNIGSGFRVKIEASDRPSFIKFSVYGASSATPAKITCSEGTIAIAEPFYTPRVLTLPFSSLAPCAGSLGTNLRSVGALTMEIDGTAFHSLDLTMRELDTGCALYNPQGGAPLCKVAVPTVAVPPVAVTPVAVPPVAVPPVAVPPVLTPTAQPKTAPSVPQDTPNAIVPLIGIKLKSICSEQPAITRRWRISNPQNAAQNLDWELFATSSANTAGLPVNEPLRSGRVTVAANSELVFDTFTAKTGNTLKLYSVSNQAKGVALPTPLRTLEDTQISFGTLCPVAGSTKQKALNTPIPKPALLPDLLPALQPTPPLITKTL